MAGAHEDFDVYRCYLWCGVELTAELHQTVMMAKRSWFKKNKKTQLYIQMVAILLCTNLCRILEIK